MEKRVRYACSCVGIYGLCGYLQPQGRFISEGRRDVERELVPVRKVLESTQKHPVSSVERDWPRRTTLDGLLAGIRSLGEELNHREGGSDSERRRGTCVALFVQ